MRLLSNLFCVPGPLLSQLHSLNVAQGLALSTYVHYVLACFLQSHLLEFEALTLELLLLKFVLQHALSSLLGLLDALEGPLLLSLQYSNPIVQLSHVLLLVASELSRLRNGLATEDAALVGVVDAAQTCVEERILRQRVTN